MLEPGAELVVREIQLRSGTGGRLHSHTLTMWFQVPMLPTRSGHMLMLDIPRRVDDTASYDVPEDEQRTGQLFIWKSGTVAPEGCQDPRVLSRRRRETYAAASNLIAGTMTGEWQLSFTVTEKKVSNEAEPEERQAEDAPQTEQQEEPVAVEEKHQRQGGVPPEQPRHGSRFAQGRAGEIRP